MADIASDDAAQARKRRIAARNQNRPTDEASPSESKRHRVQESDDDDSSDLELVLSTDANGKPKPHITGIKKQSRYDPGVPMTREELKNWRKEARRVRNRESAAASRKKNKERITELEMEVETIKTKYAAALELLLQREDGQRGLAFCPAVLRQDLMEAALKQQDSIARSSSPPVVADSGAVASVSPPLSPSIPKNTHEELLLPPPPAPFDSERDAAATAQAYEKESVSVHLPNHQQHHHHQHITPISRPIASAKISPGANDDNETDTTDSMNSNGFPSPTAYTMTMTTPTTTMDTDAVVTDVSSTASEAGSSTSRIHELDELDEADFGAFLMDTFVMDESSMNNESSDISDVATAAMLMVDMPELCI